MNLQLMFNSSDSNVVPKKVTTIRTLECILKDKTDILNPVFLLEDIDDAVFECNYCYSPELKRYYFIQDIQSVRNGLWSLVCHIDVLKTYEPWIRQHEAVIGRQEFNYNLLLADGKLKAYGDPILQTINFPYSFNDESPSYILIAGGDSTD